MNKKFNSIFDKLDFKPEIIFFDKNDFKNEINIDYEKDVFGNLSSLLKCFKIAKEKTNDLVFFLEDDYLHKKSLLEELILTYERISSQTKKELILVPSDYPFLYMSERNTNILAGSHRHWQTLDKVLCSFLTSKKMIDNRMIRLIGSRQIIKNGDKYFIGNETMLLISKLILFLKLVVIGKKSEFD